jgi:ERCC4-related helicase
LYSVFKISNPKLTFREFTNRFKFVKHKLQFGSVWNLPDSSDLEKELRRISVIWVDKREVPAVKEHIQISLFRMSSEQRKLYERSYHSARQLSSGFVTKKKRGVTTMQPVATVKTRMLQEIAQQLILLNEKLIVVTEYIGSQQVVLETLKDYKPLLIKAGMSFYEMERVIKDFENTYPILVIAVKVGALSSNLQFCNNMVFYDIPSSEINYVQMVGRIKRPIGQNDDVYLYFLAATFEANRLLSMFKGVDAASQGIYGTTRNYHNLRRKVRVWI